MTPCSVLYQVAFVPSLTTPGPERVACAAYRRPCFQASGGGGRVHPSPEQTKAAAITAIERLDPRSN
jgi:hypothetical protein